MQNDFIDGALGTLETASSVDRVVEEIGKYPPENIIATRDTHGENYPDTQEGRNLPVTHCVKGTPGWELNIKVAAALRGAAVIDKPTFGSTELAEQVAELARQDELDITLVGLCTDICVVSNALLLKAFLPETPVRAAEPETVGAVPPGQQLGNAGVHLSHAGQRFLRSSPAYVDVPGTIHGFDFFAGKDISRTMVWRQVLALRRVFDK